MEKKYNESIVYLLSYLPNNLFIRYSFDDSLALINTFKKIFCKNKIDTIEASVIKTLYYPYRFPIMKKSIGMGYFELIFVDISSDYDSKNQYMYGKKKDIYTYYKITTSNIKVVFESDFYEAMMTKPTNYLTINELILNGI